MVCGRSRRPPTWRQLLTVFQDVGLIQLSQQIEEFLMGKYSSHCMLFPLLEIVSISTCCFPPYSVTFKVKS